MKFTCIKENLLNALNKVSTIAGKNVNLPILNNILIKADNQKVELSTTNLDIAITVQLRSKIESPGSFTIPARTLLDFINLLPEDKIDLELKENELWIQCGKSHTKIKGTSSEDYPIIPSLEEGKKFVINADDLKNGLSGVLSSVAKNDIRPELSGVFSGFNLNGKPGVTFAATDSYRLAEKSIPLAQGQDELRIIIPGRTAQELARLLSLNAHLEEMDKQAILLINENQLKFECGAVQLISRLVEGNYPDYTQIIPKEFRTTALVSKEQLIKEIKAAGLFTTMGVNSVNFVFKPAEEVIHVSSTSLQAGEYSSEISGECKGEENKTLLSYRYILEGLNNMPGDKVVIKIINGDSPCIITPENDTSFLYIVMPIRQ